MNSRRVALLVTCLLAGAVSAEAQPTADDLFDPETLHEVRLFIHSADWNRLRAEFSENTYFPADLQWRNLRLRNVGVRSRGGVTRNPDKPGLKIEFDRYVMDQQFLGLTALVLDNLWDDASMVRERVSMAFFQRMGEPASRKSFCRLYVNNTFHGVYGLTEPVDTHFLLRTLGENAGYLFEYRSQGPYHAEYLGDDLEAYKLRFEPRSRRLAPDAILYAPIRDLFREVNQEVDGLWRERVEAYIDLQQFVTHVALDVFLAEDDGILGWGGMTNFYLYRPADSTVHRLLTWDKDRSFHFARFEILMRADQNELFRRALVFDDLRELYLSTLEASARSAMEEDWLEVEVARSVTVVAEAAAEDVHTRFTFEDFRQAVEFVTELARTRPVFVLEEVARLRAALDERLGAGHR